MNNSGNSFNNNHRKANWIWVAILIGIAAYFQWLIVQLHLETTRLSTEREALEAGLEKQLAEIINLQNILKENSQKTTKIAK